MQPQEEEPGLEPARIEPYTAEQESPMPWWRRPFILAGLVILLVISSLLPARSPGRKASGERARVAIEISIMAREVYAMQRHPLFRLDSVSVDRRKSELLSKFQTAVEADRSPDSTRRFAILQYALGDPGWRQTLPRLRILPGADTFQTEKELAMWRDFMASDRVPRTAVAGFESEIKKLNLGWYENLALEGVYRKAGLRDQEEMSVARAQAPFNRLIIVGILGFLVFLGGLGLGVLMAFYLNWARRNPHLPRPKLLELHPPPELERPKGEALYFVFLVYLVSFAIIQMGMGRLVGATLGSTLRSAPDYVIPLISVITVLVWLTIPVYALIRLSPRLGITGGEIGLRTKNLFGDILWGIGGWMVAIPVVVVVTLIAEVIFRGVDTPSHPAIVELAASRDFITILLLFVQASVLAPLSEELMFRGVFFRSLTPRMRWIPAVVVTSSVFAILHPQLPLGFFGLFTLGAMFNVLYALRGSLVPAIVAHAVNNTAILVAVLIIFGG